jgi:hypothetical protein
VLNDLHARLKLTRWADDFANEGWQYGTNTAYLKELVAYWIDRYDWRKQERAINAYGTSARCYYEAAHNPWTPVHDRMPVIEAPVGRVVSDTKDDIAVASALTVAKRDAAHRYTGVEPERVRRSPAAASVRPRAAMRCSPRASAAADVCTE